MTDTISYDPPIEEHPAYRETPEFQEGDVVKTLAYNGSRAVRDDGNNFIGQEKYLSSSSKFGTENDDYNSLIGSQYVVREIDGLRVKVQFGTSGSVSWIPRDLIIGVDEEKKAEYERRAAKRQRQRELREARQEQNLDELMEEVVKPHARKKAQEVWPGGTVDVDEIDWFWNPQLTNSAGMAYKDAAVPKTMASGRLAIGLAPAYYHQHGIDKLLEIVRHELIHIWEYEHPEGKGGHGPKFKQWIVDMDTHRHCDFWSK